MGLSPSGTPCAILNAQLGWKRLVGGATSKGLYSFNGSEAFTTTAAPAPRDALRLNLGFDVPLTQEATISFTYDASFAPAASSNAFKGTVSWKW